MTDVSASDWRNVMNLPALSDEDAEYILDLSIDALNIYGASLSNMTGDAGSKTVSLTSQQRGGVFMVARAVYYSFFRGIENVVIQSQSVTTIDLFSNQATLNLIREVADKLAASSVGVAFQVGESAT